MICSLNHTKYTSQSCHNKLVSVYCKNYPSRPGVFNLFLRQGPPSRCGAGRGPSVVRCWAGGVVLWRSDTWQQQHAAYPGPSQVPPVVHISLFDNPCSTQMITLTAFVSCSAGWNVCWNPFDSSGLWINPKMTRILTGKTQNAKACGRISWSIPLQATPT